MKNDFVLFELSNIRLCNFWLVCRFDSVDTFESVVYELAGILSRPNMLQVQIEKKGKNKSREEIFYQMKVFFLLRSVASFCKSARCP